MGHTILTHAYGAYYGWCELHSDQCVSKRRPPCRVEEAEVQPIGIGEHRTGTAIKEMRLAGYLERRDFGDRAPVWLCRERRDIRVFECMSAFDKQLFKTLAAIMFIDIIIKFAERTPGTVLKFENNLHIRYLE